MGMSEKEMVMEETEEYKVVFTCDGSLNATAEIVPICFHFVVLALFPFSLSIFTIMGNIFVMVAIMTDRMIARKLTSILILNLAAADLLVGAVVMPLAVTQMVTRGRWLFGRLLCRIWISLDVIASTASIVTLCVISVDRFIGVMHPLRYQTMMTRRRLVISSLLVWIFSLIVLLATIRYSDLPSSLPRPTEACQVGRELRYVPQSAVCSFFTPLAIILAVYFKIFRVTQRREADVLASLRASGGELKGDRRGKAKASLPSLRPEASAIITRDLASSLSDPGHGGRRISQAGIEEAFQKAGRRGTVSVYPPPSAPLRIHYGHSDRYATRRFYEKHKKSALTLGLVVGAFLLCWTPFFLTYLIDHFCGGCVPEWILQLFTWLGYSNSAINPIIYAIIVTAFRNALLDIIGRNLCGLSREQMAETRGSLHKKSFSYGECRRPWRLPLPPMSPTRTRIPDRWPLPEWAEESESNRESGESSEGAALGRRLYSLLDSAPDTWL